MSDRRQKPQLGSPGRRLVSLLTGLAFLVLAITGIAAFIRPFDLGVIGLHALMGFVFIGFIGLHGFNNSRPLASYLKSRSLWTALVITAVLTALFWWQPAPVKSLLALSGNLGPAMERFEMSDDGMIFDYAPSPDYRMRLTVKTGPSHHANPPPHLAIWLENQGGYHIKTLLAPTREGETPYWSFKHSGWQEAKRKAEQVEGADAITMPTPNGSFDPAEYILPKAARDSTPYQLLLEINQPEDRQPSLVYAVEIDNALPKTFQVLELRGYPKRGEMRANGKDTWDLHYVDSTFTSALDLIDSALLTIERADIKR